MLVCKGVKMREIISLLLAPCLVLGVGNIREEQWIETIPMQTLQCYNDYTSLTTCTWMECSEAHELLNVTLNFNNSSEKKKETTCRSHKGINHADCQNFTMHCVCHIHGYDQRVYNFKFDLVLHAELNVYLFQNVQTLPPQDLSVQPLPPQNLSVSLMRSGDFVLTWEAADRSQGLGNALEYEVTYKRQWESWEKAASVLLSNTTRCHLSHEDLVPGSSYIARVRAKTWLDSGFSRQYSDWSTEVLWDTPEGGLQPRNLRCLFNGADRLICSWEVKKAITTSVLFGLFFWATPASAEEECSPVLEKALPHTLYVVQSCEIPVTNSSSQSHYHVSVRAKTEEKVIEACKNIKVLPPANVSVTVTKNQEYELRWIKHNMQFGFIKQRYQVEYWKSNQYEKTLQKLNISNDEPPFIFTLQKLDSSTEYKGKMRARVNTPYYEGPWSEWSEEFIWRTENVLPPVVLPVVFPGVIITLLIVSYCSYKYFLRKKQIWEENIPNPSKSVLIQSYLGESVNQQPARQVSFKEENASEEVEQIHCLHMLDGMTESPAEFHGAEAKRVQVSHASQKSSKTAGVPHKTSHSSSTLACPLNQTAGPSCLFARLPCKSTAHASVASQTCFAFNGPYLYNSMVSSQPDIHHTLAADPVGISEKSVSLQYVNLPKEDSPQAPQRQEHPGAGPPQLFLLPDEKHTMQHLNNEREVSPASPAYGKGMSVRVEEQKSPTALSCPLEFITTESLLLPLASNSTHLSLVTAGDLPCDSQAPQPPNDHPCHEFCPGKTDVMVPVLGQESTSSELHMDVFGDPAGLYGSLKPTDMSLHVS